MGTIASGILVLLCRFSMGYAETLLKGVKATDFARKPRGIDTNHPAFLYGHLAIYPDRLCDLVSRPEAARPDQVFLDLFAAGKPCLDDPDGTIYPPMEVIVARFRSRYDAVLPVLAETPDEVFGKPNPNERMRERFPTIGMAATFLVNGHMMMHLGQMSAWRRCMGMPSAM